MEDSKGCKKAAFWNRRLKGKDGTFSSCKEANDPKEEKKFPRPLRFCSSGFYLFFQSNG